MHLFSIFMPTVAARLKEMGFTLIKTEKNLKNPKYLVYKFEDTPELQMALNKILRKE